MINYYNKTLKKYKNKSIDKIKREVKSEPKQISWSEHLYKNISLNRRSDFDPQKIVKCLYRPYTITNLYYSKSFNDRQGLTNEFFLKNRRNKYIMVSGIGSQRGYSVLASDIMPDIQLIQNGQCFGIYSFQEENFSEGLFKKQNNKEVVKKEIISSYAKNHFSSYYKNKVSSEQIFDYTYAILHSKDYFEKFKNNLSKSLPRIPRVKKYSDFQKFYELGKKLCNLHINYNDAKLFKLEINFDEKKKLNSSEQYYVKKMKFYKNKNGFIDKTKIVYNENIVIENIPIDSYKYCVFFLN